MIWLRCSTLSTTCVLSTISLSRAAHCRLNSSLSYSSSGCLSSVSSSQAFHKAPQVVLSPHSAIAVLALRTRSSAVSSSSAMARTSLPRLVSKYPWLFHQAMAQYFSAFAMPPSKVWPLALAASPLPRLAAPRPKAPRRYLGAISAPARKYAVGCCTATRRFAPTLATFQLRVAVFIRRSPPLLYPVLAWPLMSRISVSK